MIDPLHRDSPHRDSLHPHSLYGQPRRRLASILLAAVLLTGGLLAAGCQGDAEVAENETATVDAATLPPEELGRIGARLSQEPGRTEAILAEEGVTWEGFQAAVREVAANVETARRYAEAYRAAGGGEEGAPSAAQPAGG